MSGERKHYKSTSLTRRDFLALVTATAGATITHCDAGFAATKQPEIYIVSNFHPASCGWLTTFSSERVYCANSYLDHLDRVRDDSNYEFVMSEINNIIAIMNFQPARIPELKQRIQEKRVEMVNGFFLESTINLSGGEALVRLGVLGLRWYAQEFGLRPRFAWNIDTCGVHEQMAQIAAGLGLEAMVYTRKNPVGKSIFWTVSPNGSRMLTLCQADIAKLVPFFSRLSRYRTSSCISLRLLFRKRRPSLRRVLRF